MYLTHQTPLFKSHEMFQMCQKFTTLLFKPHEMFQMCQKFATCYSTVITLAQYEPI